VTGFIAIRNWRKFQHYKDRRPPWVKLHVEILDDYEFGSLPVASRLAGLLLLALAARRDNKLPDNPARLAMQLDMTPAQMRRALSDLKEIQFIVPWKAAFSARSDWSSRYISKPLRAEVLERDLHRCVRCSRTDKLEIDHIVPISQGGTSSAENLQVLCRSCNRAKRARRDTEHHATQKRSNSGDVRSPETEVETEKYLASSEPKSDSNGQGFEIPELRSVS
jgi:hypothetical protein